MAVTPQNLAYSPSHYAQDFKATLTRQAALGVDLVARHQPITLSYGEEPAARLNLFIPKNTAAPWPLMVFIHGGYWQELDNTATDFLAERYLARGMAFASLGYGLAPKTSIVSMVNQCIQGTRAACNALVNNGGVASIVLGGHSAGAQLAYWVAASGEIPIDKLILVSGIYDLTPLVDTYVNEALELNPTQARALSPKFANINGLPPCKVVIAENDPPTFRQQALDFIAALKATDVQVALVDIANRDHFDVLDVLGALKS
ncbi:alpha/beta hydrolase [Halomonas sp. ISL-60]|uniref:alpha/beta hydrolase n=1 Tax=Halomonas sp. ISL-56 TaxID=2819149 RepID=UPI001BECE0E8|nr:alpha/beta hydrolase [Halomonas sp. ISL-56]MBT2773623.1 alpha/beta hydrolase [Halomonas sp. ISL-60]MBT2802092.1 alpha/beta hydrolase [Halomonas sp. ISL-56]